MDFTTSENASTSWHHFLGFIPVQISLFHCSQTSAHQPSLTILRSHNISDDISLTNIAELMLLSKFYTFFGFRCVFTAPFCSLSLKIVNIFFYLGYFFWRNNHWLWRIFDLFSSYITFHSDPSCLSKATIIQYTHELSILIKEYFPPVYDTIQRPNLHSSTPHAICQSIRFMV